MSSDWEKRFEEQLEQLITSTGNTARTVAQQVTEMAVMATNIEHLTERLGALEAVDQAAEQKRWKWAGLVISALSGIIAGILLKTLA